MIRTSKIYFTKDLNDDKSKKLSSFIKEYRKAANLYLNYLWDNDIIYNNKIFSIQKQLLDVPMFLGKENIPNFQTNLSARALKCCLTQVLGYVSMVVKKRRKQLFIQEKYNIEYKPIDLIKPNLDKLKPELNSICADFIERNGYFNGFLQLKSIGKSFGKIKIPIKYNRQLKKWNNEGVLKKSFLITEDYIIFRFEILNLLKTKGELVGADQGLKTVITLSDGQITPKTDNHGHSLESIIEKISRKRKGSKSIFRAYEERKNFIHWSINQLNLNNIRQINLENIKNINFGKRTSRKMYAWTNTIIRDKLIRLGEEQEVLVNLTDSVYKSQRCSKCGHVRKSNRKGDTYSCKSCGTIINADLNAARNHELELPEISFELRKKRLNLGKGFFWRKTGIFDIFGAELTVSPSEN